MISATDNNTTAVIRNLEKALVLWRMMIRILRREGASPRVSVFFFKDGVQSLFLFWEETWVFIPCMVRVLGGFSGPGGADTGGEASAVAGR